MKGVLNCAAGGSILGSWRLVPLLLATMSLAACVQGPQVSAYPEFLPTVPPHASELRLAPWWRALNDPNLNGLIESGLADNPAPHIAWARLAQAQADLQVARSQRWPSLQARGRRDVTEFSDSQADTRTDLGALEFTWDAGLWGKRRLQIEQANRRVLERWFEHQAASLALSTSIAQTYFQVVQRRQQAALLEAQVAVSLDLERLIEERFRLGQAPVSQLYQQRESTAGLTQLVLTNQTDLEILEQRLDVLLGRVPDATSRVERDSFNSLDWDTATGPEATLAQDVLQHRADIRAGYARLQQAAAEVGVRFAERLPGLQVTANLSNLAQKAASAQWFAYSLDLAVPLFTGGRLRSLEQQAVHGLEEERGIYADLWLAALAEVEALGFEFSQQHKVLDTLRTRRGYAAQALEAARNRYVLGDQNYLDVLVALRGLQEVDRLLVAQQGALYGLWIRRAEAVGQPMCSVEPAYAPEFEKKCENNWHKIAEIQN